MRTPPAVVIAALALIGACGLAGCTQKSATGSNTPVVSTPNSSSNDSTSAAPSSTEVSSTAPATTSAAPTTSAPKPTASPTPSATLERGGCPTSALAIRAIRGSGAAGHQFAFLQFTNNSTATCSLTGYPGVQLLAGGRPLGTPATRSGKPITTVSIAPGTSVTASITDDSSCNAAVSDSVQVIPPNRTDKIVLKLALRGCALQVDPVTAS